MNQGNLKLRHPISDISEDRSSVFTMVGVMSEGAEEVASLNFLTSSMYSFRDMGW